MNRSTAKIVFIQAITVLVSVFVCFAILKYNNDRNIQANSEKAISLKDYGIVVSSDSEIELSTYNKGDIKVNSDGNILMYADGVFCCSIKFDGIYNASDERVLAFD